MPKESPKLAVVKKRRKRGTSLEAQLKRAAAKIYESGMAQAMNAAVGQMLIQKLDEVLQLAAVTGYRMDAVPPTSQMQRSAPPPPSQPIIMHPCTTCGRESVYKTKQNAFNRTGSWYCRDHRGVGGQLDMEDARDRELLGQQAAAATQAAPAVAQTAPVEMVKQSAPPVDPLLAAMGIADAVE